MYGEKIERAAFVGGWVAVQYEQEWAQRSEEITERPSLNSIIRVTFTACLLNIVDRQEERFDYRTEQRSYSAAK